MARSVLTLVSGQENLPVEEALRALKSSGIGRVEEPVWLERGRAADIFFEGDNPELLAALRKKIQVPRTDIFIQPDDAFRRKKLLLSDMDATMVVGETLDEIARQFGLADKIVPITERAMRGEIDFVEALRLRISLLKGREEAALHKVAEEMRFSPGGETAVKTMRRFGAKCVLISGGFDIFTGRAAARLGFHADFGNRLGLAEGRLTGEVIPPIVGKDYKKQKLEEETRALGLDIRQTMTVGDGANDIPMLQAAGAGVGYFAKPAVVEATPYQIRYTDLTALLFMQGYRKEEFAA